MVVNELFLYGSIESLTMSIHFGSSGVGVVVSHMQTSHSFVKMFFELTAVVGQNEIKGKWKNLFAEVEKFFGGK